MKSQNEKIPHGLRKKSQTKTASPYSQNGIGKKEKMIEKIMVSSLTCPEVFSNKVKGKDSSGRGHLELPLLRSGHRNRHKQ